MWKSVFNPLEATMEKKGVLRNVAIPGSSMWFSVAVLLVSSCLQVCSACESWEFRCLNGDCVKGSFRCDAVPHCPDASDELNCPALTPTLKWTPIPCGSGQFQCHNGRCIYPGWRCDGQDDCQDMSDEKSCPETEKGSPVMSMGSIIGLSIAVAGLFIVVIGIAIMMTCIRRKNMMNAREAAMQSRLFQHDCYPFSISGMMLDREPPPRYNSQPDLSILPPGMLQEHLANLAMQPPPYYTSQPDLTTAAAYCPHVLEAPPRYTSHVNLSNSMPQDNHVISPGQPEPESRRPSGLFAITNQEVLQSTFEEDVGSLDSRRGRRGWSKNSSISSKGSYKDRPLKSGGNAKRSKDPGVDRENNVKKVEVDIRDDGMEEYQGSVELDSTSQGPGMVEENALRRNRTARHCASTPALLHQTYTSDTDTDFSGYRQNQRTTIAEPIPENSRLNRAVNDNSSRRYRPHCSYSMMDIPDEGSGDSFRVDRLRIDSGHTSNVAMRPSSHRDTDMPDERPIPPPHINYPHSHTQEESWDRTSPPAPESSRAATLEVHRPPSQTVLNLNQNRLQAQQRLSKSMSTLTSSTAVQRNDSFNSVTSWDC